MSSCRLEEPEDVPLRLLITQPVEAVTVRIACDLKIFKLLDQAPGELPLPGIPKIKSLGQLAMETGAAPELLVRIMRALVAFRAVKQIGCESYMLSPSYKASKLFTDPDLSSGVCHYIDYVTPSLHTLPEYLASINYQNPSDYKNTAVQLAYGKPDEPAMSILSQLPNALKGFHSLKTSGERESSSIQDLYPIQEYLSTGYSASPNSPMLVHAAGADYDAKTVSLKMNFPDLQGRFVVQDSKCDDGLGAAGFPKIEYMKYHFRTLEQPVKGARAYYIRRVFRGFPDSACIQLCTGFQKAMKRGYSKLFVHEIVVPDRDASSWTVTQDLNAMAFQARAERTEDQWRCILARAGLRLVGVFQPKDRVSEAIIEAEI